MGGKPVNARRVVLAPPLLHAVLRDGRGVLRGVVRGRRRAGRLEREVALLERAAEVEQNTPVARELVVRDTPAA